jgi:hypothetical protein
MLHITCDLCGKTLVPGPGRRYVVRMEVYPAGEPGTLSDADLDLDALEGTEQELEETEDTSPDLSPATKSLRYDLCSNCHAKFLADPLGRETAQKFDFSEN